MAAAKRDSGWKDGYCAALREIDGHCEALQQRLLSPQYSAGQPTSSLPERFAIGLIRAKLYEKLGETPPWAD